MVRAPALRRGDVVRVVAPAGPFDAESFARGLAVLRDRFGLEPRHRDDVLAREGYLAGSDARRVEEWHEAVEDRDARAIFCARGGYGAMRILGRLGVERLVAAPKLLVGFSDITAIHAACNRAGLVTVHGPVLTQLGRAPEVAVRQLEALLFRPGAPSPGADAARASPDLDGSGTGCAGTGVIRPGRASGPLLGGSLTLLAHLCGTPYLPSMRGGILFIEDVAERPYRLDRYLTQLALSGALDGLAGVAVGQLTGCDEPGIAGADVVRGIVADLGVPAVEGLRAGHEDLNLALPLGARATLVAPEPGDGRSGPPRVIFDEGAAR